MLNVEKSCFFFYVILSAAIAMVVDIFSTTGAVDTAAVAVGRPATTDIADTAAVAVGRPAAADTAELAIRLA